MKKEKRKVLCGADVLARDGLELQGKCGLITNHTGVLRDLSSTVDMLKTSVTLLLFSDLSTGSEVTCRQEKM